MSDVQTIELSVDSDDALVTLEAAVWYVCFVPELDKQWWHPFVNRRHKHVFAMRPAGHDAWTLFEPWWHRLLMATITSEQAKKFLLWGARGDVLIVRESIPGHGSQIRGWMDCSTPILSARALLLGVVAARVVEAAPARTACVQSERFGAPRIRRLHARSGTAAHRGLRQMHAGRAQAARGGQTILHALRPRPVNQSLMDKVDSARPLCYLRHRGPEAPSWVAQRRCEAPARDDGEERLLSEIYIARTFVFGSYFGAWA